MSYSISNLIVLAVVLFFSLSYTHGKHIMNPKDNHKSSSIILFLTSDAFRNDYIEIYKPPYLIKMISEGVRVEHTDDVFPTLTTPNMTSLVTGSYPETTGIAANSQYDVGIDKIIGAPRNNKAETISEILKKNQWKTASINHFMLEHRGTDEYIRTGYDNLTKTTNEIIQLLEKGDFNFISAIYGLTDNWGHKYGPFSEKMKEAVLSTDYEVGRILETIYRLNLQDRIIISFNSDHGMTSYKESKNILTEPIKLLRKSGYKVVTNPEELNDETELIVLAYGVRIIYFRKNMNLHEREKVVNLLKIIEGVEILERDKLDSLHCHNNLSGDVIVSPLPGYLFNDGGRTGGVHGVMTDRNPVIIFWGKNVQKGCTIPAGNIIDIVPTLLDLVNVKPASTVNGRVLTGVKETSSSGTTQ